MCIRGPDTVVLFLSTKPCTIPLSSFFEGVTTTTRTLISSRLREELPFGFIHRFIMQFIAPIVKPARFRVRVPGHALGDLDSPAVGEIVRNPGGPEGVAACRGFNSHIGSAGARHAPDIPAQHRGLREGCAVLPIAERNSGPLRSPSMKVRSGLVGRRTASGSRSSMVIRPTAQSRSSPRRKEGWGTIQAPHRRGRIGLLAPR